MTFERSVKLPRTSARNAEGYLKLLHSIEPEASCGFGWNGVFLRPGASVSPAELRPNAEYPQEPVVIECVPNPRRARGHAAHDAVDLWILWRLRGGVWSELGRAESTSWHWVYDLKPVAQRALAEARENLPLMRVMPDVGTLGRRLAEHLDREIGQLEPADRGRLLAVLHDLFAARIARLQ